MLPLPSVHMILEVNFEKRKKIFFLVTQYLEKSWLAPILRKKVKFVLQSIRRRNQNPSQVVKRVWTINAKGKVRALLSLTKLIM